MIASDGVEIPVEPVTRKKVEGLYRKAPQQGS
jgi:hypothetical protein